VQPTIASNVEQPNYWQVTRRVYDGLPHVVRSDAITELNARYEADAADTNTGILSIRVFSKGLPIPLLIERGSGYCAECKMWKLQLGSTI